MDKLLLDFIVYIFEKIVMQIYLTNNNLIFLPKKKHISYIKNEI